MNETSNATARVALSLLIAAGLLSGCNLGSYDDAVDRFNAGRPQGGNPPPPQPPPPPAGFGPTLSEIQANVFTPTCATAGCHSGGNPQASLSLEDGISHAMLVGVASTQRAGTDRVEPGNPSQSYLIEKLEGPGATGQQMPANAPPLAQADIDVIRQWITDGALNDTAPPPSVPVRVASLSPVPGANLDTAPASIIAGFDREVVAASVNVDTFILEASGGDGVFGDADAMEVMAASISLATPQSAVFDLTGVALGDDTYQVTLKGTGASVIQDLDGNILDGENPGGFPSGNGTAGGDFISRFTITTPVVIGPTLTQIQAVVFTPSCAVAGCHNNVTQAGNLVLADEATSRAQLVDVPAVGPMDGSLRVVPFDDVNSYLVRKLEGAPGITGSQMPLNRPPLPQNEIDAIRQWIRDGAQP